MHMVATMSLTSGDATGNEHVDVCSIGVFGTVYERSAASTASIPWDLTVLKDEV